MSFFLFRNSLDNLVCGDIDKWLDESTCYRRRSFGIIPKKCDIAQKEIYLAKFHRLIEYLNKLLPKDTKRIEIAIAEDSINTDEQHLPEDDSKSRRYSRSVQIPIKRFRIPISKHKNDRYQWMDIVMDSTFDFWRCYRIAFHWLAASGSRLEQQVQSLQRRCTQFGLFLVSLPEYSALSDMHVLGFTAPPFLPVHDIKKARAAENSLVDTFNFIRDSCHRGSDLCDLMEYREGFEFRTAKSYAKNRVAGRQYIHVSGGIFVRVVEDIKGRKGFFWVRNRSFLSDRKDLHSELEDLFQKFRKSLI
mmetsp:Transcript_18393/g.42132  ORF Transcript_18393/g.42132 Transcript_18393/m.42132 type:complete len:304 (-) Transcript_18393:258-1169(-)